MIKIVQYDSKEQYNSQKDSYLVMQTSHIVSYITKKGNVKIVKSRYGKTGKYSKADYMDILEETLFIDSNKENVQLLQENKRI